MAANFSPQTFPLLLQSSSSDLARVWDLEKLKRLREVVGDRIRTVQQGQNAETANISRKSRWDSDSDEEPRKKKKKTEKKQRLKESASQALATSACRSLDDYALEEKLSEGAYGEVWRATRKANGDIVAVKKVKFPENRWDGFPLAALRETNVLFTLHHPNIIHAREMVIKQREGSYPPFEVFMVMDYYPYDLAFLMDEIIQRDFHQSEVKLLMRQLLDGLSFMHSRWHMHRDLKPSNLLCRPGGSLVICDFGLAKEFSDPPSSYTTKVVTLCYRPPELLLSMKADEEYDGAAVDLWSVGCIFFEMLTLAKLFPAETEAELLNLIWHTLGTPVPESEPKTRSWPEFSNLIALSDLIIKPQPVRRLREKVPEASSLIQGPYLSDIGMDLLEGFLMLDPKKRRSAASSLSHPWFTDELPHEREIGQMPF